MKNVGIERGASEIHWLIAHGLKTRAPKSTDGLGEIGLGGLRRMKTRGLPLAGPSSQ